MAIASSSAVHFACTPWDAGSIHCLRRLRRLIDSLTATTASGGLASSYSHEGQPLIQLSTARQETGGVGNPSS